MKFHTFSHYIFAPGFMFTLHLLYLFAHHHKVHKANLWLSNLPSHAPRNLSNPSCSAPACACWPVLSNMPAAGCWGGICMIHWKENYPELKWLYKGPKFLSWNYEAMAHLPSTSPSSSSRRSSSSLCMSRISSWLAKQSLPQMVRFPMGTRLMLIFQCS